MAVFGVAQAELNRVHGLIRLIKVIVERIVPVNQVESSCLVYSIKDVADNDISLEVQSTEVDCSVLDCVSTYIGTHTLLAFAQQEGFSKNVPCTSADLEKRGDCRHMIKQRVGEPVSVRKECWRKDLREDGILSASELEFMLLTVRVGTDSFIKNFLELRLSVGFFLHDVEY